MTAYKIVYSSPLDGGVMVEDFTVDCRDPLNAVRAYVKFRCEANCVTAKVMPAEEKPLFEVTSDDIRITKATEPSKLFNGYGTVVDDVPDRDKFDTLDSGWISHVTWERANSSIGVHYTDGGYRIYKSDYPTYMAFNTWVDAGGSAGKYYNENIKGLKVLKKKDD